MRTFRLGVFLDKAGHGTGAGGRRFARTLVCRERRALRSKVFQEAADHARGVGRRRVAERDMFAIYICFFFM